MSRFGGCDIYAFRRKHGSPPLADGENCVGCPGVELEEFEDGEGQVFDLCPPCLWSVQLAVMLATKID